MRLSLREQPVIKSAAYSLVCFALLLFSHSFLPSLGIFANKPTLLIAAVSSLALFEGVKYASFIGLVFSVLETLICGTNTLIFPLFYTVFAILCTWLFENFFVKNFFSWFCYTVGGIAAHAIISLFAPVSDWGIAATGILAEHTLPAFALSVAFSLPLYPVFKVIKRKTDK